MSDLFKRIKKQSLFTSILCVIFGVVFCVWPGATLIVLCRIIGLVLLAAGVLLLGMALAVHEASGRAARLIPSLICLILGIWMTIRPGTFVVLIPTLIGLVLLYHGVKDLVFCLQVKKGKGNGWWVGLIFAALTVVLGVLLVFHSWLAIKIGMTFLGIVLIYDGVSGLILNGRASRSGKRYDDVIDVEYEEE